MSNETNPWLIPGEQTIANDDIVETVSNMITEERIIPRHLYNWLESRHIYISAEQMRKIRNECSYVGLWGTHEHVLCCRVLDRWNLRQRFGVEGYYYRSKEYALSHDSPGDSFRPFVAVRLHPDWSL